MTQIVPIREVSDAQQGGVISIGNFDGVHLGHQALLSEVRRTADQIDGPAIAVVLDPHPAAILRPQHLPARLSWIELRAERMGRLGIDYLVVCETTLDFLRLSAETFFQSLVVDQLASRAVVEGPNFFFGRDRGGNVERLGQFCRQASIDFTIVQPTTRQDEMISSTRIRHLLAGGEVAAASRLLGTCHRIRGVVVRGDQRGRTIGFPTANLDQVDVVIPAHGVYAGMAEYEGKSMQAAIHIGPSPTFGSDGTSKVEIHLLDFEGDLYQQSLQVDFVDRVRDIARFDSADHLADQLTRDVITVRSLLNSADRGDR